MQYLPVNGTLFDANGQAKSPFSLVTSLGVPLLLAVPLVPAAGFAAGHVIEFVAYRLV